MRFVKTSEQAADIFTKGSFTEHTWYHLLDLIQIAPMKLDNHMNDVSASQTCSASTKSPSNQSEDTRSGSATRIQPTRDCETTSSTPERKPKPAPSCTPDKVPAGTSKRNDLAPRKTRKSVSFDPVVSTQALGFLSWGVPLFQSFNFECCQLSPDAGLPASWPRAALLSMADNEPSFSGLEFEPQAPSSHSGGDPPPFNSMTAPHLHAAAHQGPSPPQTAPKGVEVQGKELEREAKVHHCHLTFLLLLQPPQTGMKTDPGARARRARTDQPLHQGDHPL